MVGGLYRQVTDAVLAQLENTRAGDWICPWHRSGGGLPTNGTTGHRYRGINILNLWCAAANFGFVDNRWATYRQWQAQGAQVRKGEKGSLVLFYKEIDGQSAGPAASRCVPQAVSARCAVERNGHIRGVHRRQTLGIW